MSNTENLVSHITAIRAYPNPILVLENLEYLICISMKGAKKKTTKKKASKKTVKTAKKTTNDTNDRKARDAKHRQVIRENHGKRRDTLHRDKIIRDGGALVDWH